MNYYHKYLYMFRTSICPSSGFQVVYCCMWCSALATRTLCSFLPLTFPNPLHDHASRIQTHTQCTRLYTGSLGPQPQHLGKYHLFSNNTRTHSQATHTPTKPPPIQLLIHHPLPHTHARHIQTLRQPHTSYPCPTAALFPPTSSEHNTYYVVPELNIQRNLNRKAHNTTNNIE